MRIVSWNINGQVPNLRKMLNAIGADVCLLQEPNRGINLGPGTGRSADTSAITWSDAWVMGSGAQDNYFYGYSQNVRSDYHLVQPDPRNSSQIELGYNRQYLILKVKHNAQPTSIRLATFHAPYGMARESRDDSNITAVEYLQALIGTGLTFKRPPKPGVVAAPAPQKNIDVILADTNVYDNLDCNRLAWPCVLNSTTGRGAAGGSLDRVFIRPGSAPNYRVGRIFVEGNAQPVSSVDRRGGNVVDIALPDEPAYQDWMRSDHLAIYLDTDRNLDILPAFVRGAGKNVRLRDTLLELDEHGVPREVKKPSK